MPPSLRFSQRIWDFWRRRVRESGADCRTPDLADFLERVPGLRPQSERSVVGAIRNMWIRNTVMLFWASFFFY